MFFNTDDNGYIYINGWSVEPEETDSVPRFFKCRMNWDLDRAQEIAMESEKLCAALETLGEYFAENDLDIFTEPDLGYLSDEEEAERLLEVWRLFCGGYDYDTKSFHDLENLAEQRLGGRVNTFIRAKRILKVKKLGAPAFITDSEIYEFARALALTRACEELTCVDIAKDRYDSETHMLGEFNENDISCVFELIRNDCTVMPCVEMAYTLFVNEVLGMRRLDIFRNAKEIKPTVDELLETLSKNERKVLKSLYGLSDGVRRTYGQTALETYIPLPMIRDYENRAIRKLFHCLHIADDLIVCRLDTAVRTACRYTVNVFTCSF